MNLKLLTIIFTLLSIMFFQLNIYAQSEDGEDKVDAPLNNENVEAISELPNLLALSPKWWNYFEVKEEELLKKVSEFKIHINTLSVNIGDEYISEKDAYIKRINASLNALIELKKVNPSFALEDVPYKEQYTLDELSNLERKRRDLELTLKRELPNLKDNLKATDFMARKIDTLYAAYRKFETSGNEKLIAGLEIISIRLAWLVSKQKQPLQKARLDSIETEIESLRAEIKFALNNFYFTDNELSLIEKSIEKQTITFESAHSKSVDAQSKILEIVEDDILSSFKSILLKEESLLAEINLTSEEVKLENYKTVKSIILLKLRDENKPINSFAEEFKNREIFLKNVRQNIKTWNARFRDKQDELNAALLETYDFGENRKNIENIIKARKETIKESSLALKALENTVNDLAFFNSIVRDNLNETQGLITKLRLGSSFTLKDLWNDSINLLNKSLFSISDVPVTSIDLLHAIVIVLIAYFISRVVRKLLNRISLHGEDRTSPVIYTLGRLSHYIIIIIGLIIALASIGINFTNIAIIAGALSVGIGFGLQSIVNNFVSGIIILFEQNLKVGDFVELDAGMKGIVKGIHVRSTIITTLDNLDIIVPNSELVSAKVTNYTMSEPMYRMHIPFGVAYGSDKNLVIKAGLEAAKKVEVTYDDGAKRRPQVWLVEFGDSSLNFELIVWVVKKKGSHATPGSWRALYTYEIETALHEHGIEIPFPQRDIHLKSGFQSI